MQLCSAGSRKWWITLPGAVVNIPSFSLLLFIFTHLICRWSLLLWWPYIHWEFIEMPQTKDFLINSVIEAYADDYMVLQVSWEIFTLKLQRYLFFLSSSCLPSIIDAQWLWFCLQWKCAFHKCFSATFTIVRTERTSSIFIQPAAELLLRLPWQNRINSVSLSNRFYSSTRCQNIKFCLVELQMIALLGVKLSYFCTNALLDEEFREWSGAKMGFRQVPLHSSLSNYAIDSSCSSPLKPL